ncbi:MAG: protein kinase [Candidatus Wallbacteria bacterium]|nr:protein kinase [Candidatus Wallbacteria bacterium]
MSSQPENSSEITRCEDRTIIESDRTAGGGPGSDTPRKINSFRGYRVLEMYPAAGAEADIYRVGKDGLDFILKLYRFGNTPNLEALSKAREIGEKFPDDLIRIYESDFDPDLKRYFEVMEYVRFGSLKDLIAERFFSGDRFNLLLREMLNGLKILHSNNLLHLDLKPSNVLVRSLEPLKLVFTDFGVSSVIDDEISRKMTMNLKGTPLYWSPEAFTQVVGRESDFWSLGIVLLEILTLKHPFQGLDMRNIMYTLSTKGVEVPVILEPSHQLLLKGLLTRNPKKRWGIAELERWLSGELEIDIFFDYRSESKEYQIPFSFQGLEFHSLTELVHAFIRDEECWNSAKQLIAKGFLEDWLKKNGDYENCVICEKLRKLAKNDPDFTLVKIMLAYLKGTGFVFYGRLITFENVFLFATRVIAGRAGQGETAIVRAVVTGALHTYYLDYLTAVQKDPEQDDFSQLLSVMKFNLPKISLEDSLTSLFRIFDFWWKPGEFFFPEKHTIKEKLSFLKNHADSLLKKKELQQIQERYFIPLELAENLGSQDLQEVIDALEILKKMREDKALIEKDRISDEVFSVKDYLQIGKFWKFKVEVQLYLKIASLLQAVERPRFKGHEFHQLREYLMVLRGPDVEWTKYDLEALKNLLQAIKPHRYFNSSVFLTLSSGIALALIFVILDSICLYLLGDMLMGNSLLGSMVLLALGCGLFLGTYSTIDAFTGDRIASFGRGFFSGVIGTLVLEFMLRSILRTMGPLSLLCSGFPAGAGLYLLWCDYYRERRISRVYESFLYRITAVVNQDLKYGAQSQGK